MKFLVDENISIRIANALDAIVGDAHQFIDVKQHFKRQGAYDVSVIHSITGTNFRWALLTKDQHLRSRRHEVAALKEATLQHGVYVFFADRKFDALSFTDQAAQFIRLIPALLDSTGSLQPGWFRLPAKGKKLVTLEINGPSP